MEANEPRGCTQLIAATTLVARDFNLETVSR